MKDVYGLTNNKEVLKDLNKVLNKNVPQQYVSNWSNKQSRRLVPRDIAVYMREVVVQEFLNKHKIKLSGEEKKKFIDSLQPTLYCE